MSTANVNMKWISSSFLIMVTCSFLINKEAHGPWPWDWCLWDSFLSFQSWWWPPSTPVAGYPRKTQFVVQRTLMTSQWTFPEGLLPPPLSSQLPIFPVGMSCPDFSINATGHTVAIHSCSPEQLLERIDTCQSNAPLLTLLTWAFESFAGIPCALSQRLSAKEPWRSSVALSFFTGVPERPHGWPKVTELIMAGGGHSPGFCLPAQSDSMAQDCSSSWFNSFPSG